MIVDTNNNRYRIQVKHASLNENGSYSVNMCNTVCTATKSLKKHYTKEDVDFIVTIIEDQLVVVPVELIERSNSKVFRTELPKYGTKSNCNLIKDYTMEKYIS